MEEKLFKIVKRDDVSKSIFFLTPVLAIILNNNSIGNLNPQERRKYLMAFSPEDRMEQAAIPQMKIFENVALNNFKSSNFFNKGLIDEKKFKSFYWLKT